MTERERQILSMLVQMDKQFGKGSVQMLASGATQPIPVISSGSIAIDNALRVGGFPRGRIIEISALNPPAKRHWRCT